MSKLSSAPNSRRAMIQDSAGKPLYVDNIPVPSLAPFQVLIKTLAVALNPSDYKMCAAFPTPGAVVGNDFVGSIIAIAEGTETDLVLGEIVCGGLHSSDPDSTEDGAFAEYVRAPVELLLRVGNIDITHAATLGTALATCTLALWGSDALNLPATPGEPAGSSMSSVPVLVYGGSTATGTMAIQLLRLSGFNPIATCSPHNFDLVRSYGATAVFDYTLPGVASKIKAHTGGRLKHVLDCISDTQSVDCCYSSIARVGGRYICLEYVPEELLAKRRAVKSEFVLAFQALGVATKLPRGYAKPADSAKRDLSMRCFAMYQRLVNEGKLRSHPIELLQCGLQGVLEGLSLLKTGSISGKKLVVLLDK